MRTRGGEKLPQLRAPVIHGHDRGDQCFQHQRMSLQRELEKVSDLPGGFVVLSFIILVPWYLKPTRNNSAVGSTKTLRKSRRVRSARPW